MEPQRLKATQGWEWIKQGYALFIKAPLLWIVILLIGVIAVVGLSSMPVVGEPLVSLLMPVLLVGLMDGCRALEQGDELELLHLISGFRQHTSQLVTLGGITLVAQYLILGLMMLVGGATLVGLLMSGTPDNDPTLLLEAISGASVAVLLGLALFMLLMMAMQFAPMLVYFHDIAPVAAMKLSLRAFLRNAVPMLVYGITFLFLAVLASLPMMLGWILLLPLVFTSLYASFQAIFPSQAAAVSPQDETPAQDEQGHF